MIVAGAGGHAREVLDILLRKGYPKEQINFYDDLHPDRELIHDYFRVIKNAEQLNAALNENKQFCLGVGNPFIRKKLYGLFVNSGGELSSLTGKVIVSDYSKADQGIDMFDNVYVGPNTSIGFGVLLNTKSSVHHDSIIGVYSEIGPGATLLGGVNIGSYCSVGSMAVILPRVTIGNNVTIGAGSVVNCDIQDNAVAVGVPAHVIKTQVPLTI